MTHHWVKQEKDESSNPPVAVLLNLLMSFIISPLIYVEFITISLKTKKKVCLSKVSLFFLGSDMLKLSKPSFLVVTPFFLFL